MVPKLEALDGVTVHQRGDHEVRVIFHPDRLDAIADLLKARKRRRLSDDQKARLAMAGAKFRYPARRTDARTDSRTRSEAMGRSGDALGALRGD
jgi:hypothetical protein